MALIGTILNSRKALQIIVIAVAILILMPSKVNAQCSIMSVIWGGDCVSTLNGGITDRTEIRQENRTERVQLEQENETQRVLLEQQNETERVRIEQQQMTDRNRDDNYAAMEQMEDFTEMQKFIMTQETTQALADALVQKHTVDTLADVAVFNAQAEAQKLAQQEQILSARWSLVKNIGALLVFLGCVYLIMKRQAEVKASKAQQREQWNEERGQLDQPQYWVVEPHKGKEYYIEHR